VDTIHVVRLAIEILIFAAVIYAFIRFLQESRGSAVLKGFMTLMIVLGVAFVPLVRFLGLAHLEYIADRGLLILLFALIVVFQPELRQALVRLGESRFFQRSGRLGAARTEAVEAIVEAVDRLARRGLGAILLVERRVGISGFAQSGVRLDAVLSVPLLVSIFDKDTPLHDGAVVIQDGRILAAACVLPLTENPNLSLQLGTRHRAAIGVTEENDAVAVVVSEETRRISVARHGRIEENLSLDHLRAILLESDRVPEPAL
jgi:diadenylate cyclase